MIIDVHYNVFYYVNLSNMVNPLSSIAGTALFGLASARPALVKVSPARQDGVILKLSDSTVSRKSHAPLRSSIVQTSPLTFAEADALHRVCDVVQLHETHN